MLPAELINKRKARSVRAGESSTVTKKAPARHRIAIGDAPECGPGERDKAQEYVDRIDAAIKQGGWAYGERNHLYVLKGKWRKRAQGKDIRFNMVGTRGGRLTFEEEIKLRELVARAKRRRDKQSK